MQQVNTIALLSRYPAPVRGKSGAQYTGPTRSTAQAAFNLYGNRHTHRRYFHKFFASITIVTTKKV